MNYSDELKSYDSSDYDGLDIENLVGNTCDMPQYEDGHFDLVHSNSVLEHVGSYKSMYDFSKETQRVGRYYYIQTPNYFFPIDPHYSFPMIHWLPDSLKIWALTRFKVGTAITGGFSDALAEVDNCKMISKWLFREFYPDAQHRNERFLLVFRKSFIAIGSRFYECPKLD